MDLALVWGVLLALVVLIYVILDGFDLGVGILFPFFRRTREKDILMTSVAPVWDGNETWLILGGGGLFAAFPLAYAILMPALYPLVIVMLLGLVFRGVSFEFRFRTKHQYLWDWGFFGGSIVATLMQGIMLGAVLQGVAVEGRAYAGGWFDWLTPFSLFCGLALLIGYTLLGLTWLIMKTEGDLQTRCFRYARYAAVGLLTCIGTVSIWLPVRDADIAARWFSFPASAVFWLVPVVLAALTAWFFLAVHHRKDVCPYFLSLGFFVVASIGFGISVYPYVVPREVTLWQAASPDSSLIFLLIGVGILIPMIIAYTGYAYWVFRGKVDPDEGYH